MQKARMKGTRIEALLACGMLLCMVGCAHQDEWTRGDTVRQVMLYTVMTADAYSTTNIQYDPHVREIGPLARQVLGAQPSTSDTWQYFITAGLVHYAVVRSLPAQWRPWYQGAFIAGHTAYIINNAKLGLFNRTTPPEPFIGPICRLCPIKAISQ